MKLSIKEFSKKRRDSQPAYVFDLRSAEEYQIDHLAGAHNLPFQYLESNLHRLPFSGDILFYDGGEGISKQAADILCENGFSDYFFVEEGHENLKKFLKDSSFDIKLSCTKDDPVSVQKEVLQNLLNLEINPAVSSHGGYFSLIDIKDNNVYVELSGGCQGCGMVDVTLRQGVEKRMREVFPDMTALIDITDHAEGENPYYQPSK